MTFIENFALILAVSPIVLGLSFVVLNWLVDELQVIADFTLTDFYMCVGFLIVCAVIAYAIT